jgi:hypothetical protein
MLWKPSMPIDVALPTAIANHKARQLCICRPTG